MPKLVNREGMRFGYLIVLNREPNKGQKVKWKCKCDCGEICIKRSDQLNEESMCPSCAKIYAQGLILSPTGKLHPNIINETGNKHGKLTAIEIDKEASLLERGIVWKCKCDCGGEKSVNGNNLRDGTVTSCGCNHIKIEPPGKEYGFLTIIKRIENSNAGKARYLCQCKCGNTCEAVGSDLRSGQQISCGCIKSKGEEKIIQILIQNNISFIKEKTFNTCKDEKELPFDFYINNKYIIEYDGKQHYDPKHAWNSFRYEQTKKHDEIKTQWCKENNIPLIRIPYTHLNDLCLEDLQLETSKFILS